MAAILSTKKLSLNQKELLLNAGHSFVEHDFIAITPIPFQAEHLPENIILTSKNAAKIVLNKVDGLQDKKVFCVGEKTAVFLREKRLRIKEIEDYGHLLAENIISHYPKEKFVFFCGRKRRPELPDMLRDQNIQFEEIEVYDTLPVQKKYERIYDGVLFFSPSAVKSFCASNDLSQSIAFCIGDTTATEAEKHTARVRTAKRPSIENVIVQVVKHFGNSRISS